MVIASSISSVSSGMWQQIQSQQAQRAADQAMQNANALQNQAREAHANAARAQESARALDIQASQAQSEANRAAMGVQAANSIREMQSTQNQIYTRLPEMAKITSQPVISNLTVTTTTPSVGTQVDTVA